MDEGKRRRKKTKSINSIRSIWYSGFVQSNDRLLLLLLLLIHQMETQIEIEISMKLHLDQVPRCKFNLNQKRAHAMY